MPEPTRQIDTKITWHEKKRALALSRVEYHKNAMRVNEKNIEISACQAEYHQKEIERLKAFKEGKT